MAGGKAKLSQLDKSRELVPESSDGIPVQCLTFRSVRCLDHMRP